MKTKRAEGPHATFTTLDSQSGLPVAVKVWPDEVDRIQSCHAVGFRTTGSVIHYNSTGFVRVTQSRVEVIDALQRADEEAKRRRVAEGHNPDRVTYGQLDPFNEGWRLLTLAEIEHNHSHDQPVRGVELWAPKVGLGGWMGPANGTAHDVTYRTKHPVGYFQPAPKIALGHNPAGLTEEQVGVADGWRLLAPEEIMHRAATPDIQARVGEGTPVRWVGNYRGDYALITYRTKKPAGYYLPMKSETRSPEPAAKPPVQQEEIKLPGGTVFLALRARRELLWNAAKPYAGRGFELTRRHLLTEVLAIDKALDEIKSRGYGGTITLTREH